MRIAFLLQDPAEGLTTLVRQMECVPRNSEYLDYESKRYVVTGHKYLLSPPTVLVSSEEAYQAAKDQLAVDVEVTAWRR